MAEKKYERLRQNQYHVTLLISTAIHTGKNSKAFVCVIHTEKNGQKFNEMTMRHREISEESSEMFVRTWRMRCCWNLLPTDLSLFSLSTSSSTRLLLESQSRHTMKWSISHGLQRETRVGRTLRTFDEAAAQEERVTDRDVFDIFLSVQFSISLLNLRLETFAVYKRQVVYWRSLRFW